MKTYVMRWGKYRLTLGPRTLIMGILNVTPDSFSDGGKYIRPDEAVERGEQMAAAGADIIDIGGESTRPFSEGVSAKEEIQRVIPVIETLSRRIAAPISIDTTKAAVAEAALRAGASIVNDIGALRLDVGLADVAADYDVPLILMHMQGTPKNMQVEPRYGNLFAEINTFLEKAMVTAEKHGVSRTRIILDPGIGFGKTTGHNLQILKHLEFMESLDRPVLVGSSRKAFIRKTLTNEAMPELPPAHPFVETGTQATVAAAVMKGAHIVRVHDVANTRATVNVLTAIKQAEVAS
ncbi:MAG: dihydropteroate synthase [Deltaproteobacteria bacterium]|nr:dihydropteroate synthase [Deltaproteobacteria bacterium]